jgi:xylan 1,4-beta-xylosidase
MSFRNPILPGFFPDPSVCRVGDDYYLANSTFTYVPGVPISHSRNLVEWSQIGNALDRPSQLDLSATETWSSFGVCAPTLRHHEGLFWLITNISSTAGVPNFFVAASDPSGPWSEPTFIDIFGIDPDLCWHDDRCFVHFSSFDAISRVEIDERTGEILAGPEPVWKGTGLQFPEGPHLFFREGWWYLLIAEGGTERGHAVSIARSSSPTGPWEGCPSNPILSHRSTSHPVQNIGHADMVDAVDGSWWMVLHGVRVGGVTPGFHVMGRETCVVPVSWVDGWPECGPLDLEMDLDPPGPGLGERPGARVNFEEPVLGPEWLSIRQTRESCSSFTERPGWLRIDGPSTDLSDAKPAFIGRRQQHSPMRVSSLVELAGAREAGLVLRMADDAHYEIGLQDGEVVVSVCISDLPTAPTRLSRPEGPATLFIETTVSQQGFDKVALGIVTAAGDDVVVGEFDGRFLSTEVVGGFIGRVIGMYALGGAADFKWFDYHATELTTGG